MQDLRPNFFVCMYIHFYLSYSYATSGNSHSLLITIFQITYDMAKYLTVVQNVIYSFVFLLVKNTIVKKIDSFSKLTFSAS